MVRSDAGADSLAPPHAAARLAGGLYVLVVITGVFGLGYAPARVFAGDTEAELLRNIAGQTDLLRLGVLAELACYTAFIALALALHHLLAPWGAYAAALMAALAIASAPFGWANATHLLEIARHVEAGGDGAAILAALDRYKTGLLVQSVPWGLWLIPLGVLLIRSGVFPRFLAVLLIARGVGYAIDLVARLVAEEAWTATGIARVFSALGLAEMATAAWLLLFGARRSLLPWRRPA
jgi:hypothetical protein